MFSHFLSVAERKCAKKGQRGGGQDTVSHRESETERPPLLDLPTPQRGVLPFISLRRYYLVLSLVIIVRIAIWNTIAHSATTVYITAKWLGFVGVVCSFRLLLSISRPTAASSLA